MRTPARIYDLRSTFASNALAAGVSVFELARIMGTSVAMIERHYGALLDGSGADIARRLSAFEADARRHGRDALGGRLMRLGHYWVTSRGAPSAEMALASSAPGRIRTCDPLLRRQPLCPLSYGGE